MRKMLGVALALFLMAAAVVVMTSPAFAQARTRFSWIIVDTLTITGDATVGDDLAVTGDSTLTGDLTVATDTTLGALVTLSAAATETVTNTAFVPDGAYSPITATEEVTPTVTVASAGQVVVLVNAGSNTINIADTGTTKLTAAAALGQYDSLTLISDGTNWIEVSRANN